MTIPIFIPYFFVLFYCPGFAFHSSSEGRQTRSVFNTDATTVSPLSRILSFIKLKKFTSTLLSY